MELYVFHLFQSSLRDQEDIFVMIFVIIINSKVSTFPIASRCYVVLCLRRLSHHILSVIISKYPGKFWLLFPSFLHNLRLCLWCVQIQKYIKVWMKVVFACRYHYPIITTKPINLIYILSSVPNMKTILSNILCAISGAVRFYLTHCSCDYSENICLIS